MSNKVSAKQRPLMTSKEIRFQYAVYLLHTRGFQVDVIYPKEGLGITEPHIVFWSNNHRHYIAMSAVESGPEYVELLMEFK